MFAKGPVPGATPKDDAMALLPEGTTCRKLSAAGITGFIVELPDGTQVGSGGSSNIAWRNAHGWALRHPEALTRPKKALAGGGASGGANGGVSDGAGARSRTKAGKPIERPPGTGAPPELQRKIRSIRLNDERWNKLQRLGMEWLEKTLDKTREP